jgi:thioredoxin 1
VNIHSIPLGIVGVLLALFVAIQLVPVVLAHRMKGRQAPDMSALLNERQRRAPRLLLYFWSPSCGMCRSVTPIIEELMKERDDVISVDITQHMELARAYRIMGTPAMAVVERGMIVSVRLGARTLSQIHKMLEG